MTGGVGNSGFAGDGLGRLPGGSGKGDYDDYSAYSTSSSSSSSSEWDGGTESIDWGSDTGTATLTYDGGSPQADCGRGYQYSFELPQIQTSIYDYQLRDRRYLENLVDSSLAQTDEPLAVISVENPSGGITRTLPMQWFLDIAGDELVSVSEGEQVYLRPVAELVTMFNRTIQDETDPADRKVWTIEEVRRFSPDEATAERNLENLNGPQKLWDTTSIRKELRRLGLKDICINPLRPSGFKSDGWNDGYMVQEYKELPHPGEGPSPAVAEWKASQINQADD